jgi:hypothetical protein
MDLVVSMELVVEKLESPLARVRLGSQAEALP